MNSLFRFLGLVVVVGCQVYLAWPASALAQQDSADESLVFFRSPEPHEAVFGDVAVDVEVLYPDVTEVVILVDGREVGRLSSPPYTLEVALGENFGPHRFEAIASGPEGELGRGLRLTPGIAVDEEIDLELLQLYVALETESGDRPELSVADFEVRDQGEVQDVVTFEGGDAALTVAVLIDASDSMAGGRLEAALAGARAFFAGMKELDEAATFLFSDVVRWRTPFSQNPLELGERLSSVTSRGGTALNDALYRSLRELEQRTGRRVIILLTDGVDIHSLLEIDQVVWAARRSRAVVYWIELREGARSGLATSHWRDSEGHADEMSGLRRLVIESGGRIVPIEGPENAAEAFGSILEELRAQYILGYYPSVNLGDGKWHRVRVRVRRPGIRVRTRGGYVDYD